MHAVYGSLPVRFVSHPLTPVLRRKARKVTDFGPELQTLIDDMVETMRAAPGVGLAAPQVAESLQVIVVEYSEEDEEDEKPHPSCSPWSILRSPALPARW